VIKWYLRSSNSTMSVQILDWSEIDLRRIEKGDGQQPPPMSRLRIDVTTEIGSVTNSTRLQTVWVPNPVPPMPASTAAPVATATPMAAAMISTMISAAMISAAATMTFREGRRRDEQASGDCCHEREFTNMGSPVCYQHEIAHAG
jgi:hypothetical protein